MKTLIISTILLFSNSWALACRPYPIEWQHKLKNKMTMHLLNEAEVSIEQIKNLNLEIADVKYEWIHNNSSYQCHDKQTVTLKISLNSVNNKGKTCNSSGSVTLTESFYEGGPAPEYSISELSQDCL
jgi:hypothetical protein